MKKNQLKILSLAQKMLKMGEGCPRKTATLVLANEGYLMGEGFPYEVAPVLG